MDEELKLHRLIAPTRPSPDADGYWHYTYVTYHPDTGEWYGGKHTTSNLNDGYSGSGNWVSNHPAQTELITEIIEFFYSEDHAFAAEASLIDLAVIDSDPLCRNKIEGGLGISVSAAAKLSTDPEWRRKVRGAAIRKATDPEWRRMNRETLARVRTDPDYQRKIREASAKRSADPEYRQKNREALARMRADPDYQQKHREGVARMQADPQWQRKNREALARLHADPECQRKVREAAIKRSLDPEWRRKTREAAIRRAANRRANLLQTT